MISTLTALLAHKYGKIALEVIVIGGLVIGAYKWAETRGRQAQKESDAGAQATQIEQERQQAATARDKLIEQVQADKAAAEQRAQAAQQQFATLAALLQNLAARSDAGRQQVAHLQDSELHGDVVGKLALRQPGESPACYTPREERAIDDAITQWPICEEKKKVLISQVSSSQDEVAAREDTIAAMQKADAAQAAYIALLESDYKKLWEMHPPKYRAGKCLWLWSCGKRKVDFAMPGKAGL